MRNLITALLAAVTLLLSPMGDAARNLPPKAKRGIITAHQFPFYKIGANTYRLAVGGKIYNEQNLIITPASLQQPTAEVMYQTDMNGELAAIWLLTPEEARMYPRPKASDILRPPGR